MNSQHPQMRAAIYSRVSSAQQATEEKVSLDEQFRDMESYCIRKGYTIVARFQDVGSGASKRRPRFLDMLNQIQDGRFDVVVAWKSDRLARGMYPAAALMEALEGRSVGIECVKDTIDLKTFGILAAVAKIELDNIRERVRMGHRGRARKGKAEGVVKYGYDRDAEGRPVPHPLEAGVVRRVFADYVQGMGPGAIADRLNTEGLLTRKGRPWTRTAVQHILSAPIYIGKGFYDRRRFLKRDNGQKETVKVVWKPREEWVPVSFPELVTTETWEGAQAIRRRNARLRETARQTPVLFPLQGLVWCAHCGCRLMGHFTTAYSRYRRKDGSLYKRPKLRPYRRYICYAGVYKNTSCPKPRIGARTIEDAVWDTVMGFLERPESIQAVLSARRHELEEGGSWADLDRARRQLAEVEQEEQRAVTAFVKGYVDEQGLSIQIKFIKERKEHYQEEVARLEREAGTLGAEVEALSAWLASAGSLRKRLALLTPEERAQALRAVVDKVVLDGGKVEVVLALDLERVSSDLASCPRRRRHPGW